MYRKLDFNVDFALFFNTENNPDSTIKYLTGINCDYGILLLRKNKKPILFISSLEKKPRNSSLIIKHITSFKNIFSLIDFNSSKKLGLNYSKISKSLFDFLKIHIKTIRFVDVSPIILSSRKQKDSFELKKIKEAVRITELIFLKLFRNFHRFKTEFEAVQFLKKQFVDFGLEQSFEPIVASGKNSSNPHYFPKKNFKLNNGFCIIDFGVKFDSYCSDMTRTIFIGSPSKDDLIFYNSVLSEVKRLSSSLNASSKKFSTSFKMVHALGHGLGLDVHELPQFGSEIIGLNSVIALEPARYSKKGGVRIEDNYFVKKNGLVRLGSLSQELKIVKNRFCSE